MIDLVFMNGEIGNTMSIAEKKNDMSVEDAIAHYTLWCDASPLSKQTIGGWAAVILTPEGERLERKGLIPEHTTSVKGKFLAVVFSLREIPDHAAVHVFCDYTPVVDDIRTLIQQSKTGIDLPDAFGFLDTFTDIWGLLKIELQRLGDLQIDWVRWNTDNLHYHRAKELAEQQIPDKKPIGEKPIGGKPVVIPSYIGDYTQPIKDRLEHLGFRLFKGDLQRVVKCLFTKKQRKAFACAKFPMPDDSVLIAAAIKSQVLLLDGLQKLEKERTYQIWCDSSFHAGKNRGGWGAVIIAPNGKVSEDSGVFPFCRSSTEAELWGIVFSLKNVPDGYSVEIFCDCSPAVEALQGLAWKEKALGCLHKYKLIIDYLNVEIERLEAISPRWVKGHSHHAWNNRADELAGIQSRQTG